MTTFDAADGIRLIATLKGFRPAVTKSSDGKIWFLNADTVSVIDPSRLAINTLPPPVHIEQITADRKTYDVKARFAPASLVRDLTIDYTALSLVAPEKVHFKYKLEGQDRDWKEVVNDRQVQYSNLPPRNYRFRVIACNNSGVWNDTGDTLEFSIAPRLLPDELVSRVRWSRLSSWRSGRYTACVCISSRGNSTRIWKGAWTSACASRAILHDTLLAEFSGADSRFPNSAQSASWAKRSGGGSA